MLPRLLALAVAAIALSTQAHAQQPPDTILNVSYDIGRELYADIDKGFEAAFKDKAGQPITVKQSHAGTSSQARAILEGLQADVVTFNQVPDVQILHDRGNLIPADWQSRLPNNSSPYYSLPAFVVRAGNPKDIRNWDDLVRDDVKVVFPNPKTSGNARYTILAAAAFAKEKFGNDQAKVDEFLKKLVKNVPVFDTGGRGATTTFIDRNIGDVLVTFEAETAAVKKQYGADKVDVVVPPVSILAEFPVAIVDKVVDKRGSRPVAEAYLAYLYSPAGQEIIARYHNRVYDPGVMERLKDQFPPVRLVKVEDVFGSWPKVMAEYFGSTGTWDRLVAGN